MISYCVDGSIYHAVILFDYGFDGIGFAEIDGNASDFLGGGETFGHGVHDEDTRGAAQDRGVGGHETDGTGSEDGDGFTGFETGKNDAVPAGGEDVGEENEIAFEFGAMREG